MTDDGEFRTIHGAFVQGIGVDPETRCAHYHGSDDVIALRFYCCDGWFPCIDCHTALAGHPVEVWPRPQHNAEAVLCGRCGARLSVTTYLGCGHRCPACGGAFNPGCANHHHLYFEPDS